VREALSTSTWDFARPGFFCWTGVTMYLEPDVVAEALRSIAALGPGTEISFTYLVPEHLLEGHDREVSRFMITNASKAGEPLLSFFAPDEIEAVTRAAGFDDIEHYEPTASAYFRNRRDGLLPHRVERLVVASVRASQ
jgi:O-methyltransferase involved in polyketide biosynthesis